MTNNDSKRLRFGSYEVDLHTGELWKHGTRLKLVCQPFEILAVLLERSGQLVTREELRSRLWPGETFVDFNHGLNAAVNKLRDVLCDSADEPKYIETLPRRGYRFIAAVESLSLDANGRHADLDNSPIAPKTNQALKQRVSADEHEPAIATYAALETMPKSRERRRWAFFVVASVIAMLGFWMVAGRRTIRTQVNEKPVADTAIPVRLTPLTTLSDRTSQPAFSSDGTRVAFLREGFLPANAGIWVKQVGGEELIQLTNDGHDCCPVWSPDGHTVAFSRFSERRRTIDEVSARGGHLRELFATIPLSEHGEMDWSPDGKTIAYVAMGTQGSSAIFLLTLANRTSRQLTSPSALDRDWGPAFSPDGSQIAFVRRQDIMSVATEGKEILDLAKVTGRVMGSPAWTADGRSIVFASITGEEPSLLRVPASGGAVTRIREAGNLAWSPAISKRGFRLACDELTIARSIDQIELYPAGQKARALVTTPGGENAGMQISPDGTKLLFQSDRTGGMDIWVSDRDGQNTVQMTAMGTASAPRWSPDGREIAFEVRSGFDQKESHAVFLVKASGGAPWPLLQDAFDNRVPRWSRDGKWIYFASNRAGGWQVWKIQEWGGSPVQITHQGGFAVEESPDGRYLYYAKHNLESPEIWEMPSSGGPETQVSSAVRPLDWAAWSTINHGILFVESGTNGDPTVSIFDSSAQRVRRVAVLDRPPFWVTATVDGKVVVFDQPGQPESHVTLLENFH